MLVKKNIAFITMLSLSALQSVHANSAKESWVTISESKRVNSVNLLKNNFNYDQKAFVPRFVSKSGISILKLENYQINSLGVANHKLVNEKSCPGFIAHDSYEEALEFAQANYEELTSSKKVDYSITSEKTVVTIKELMEAVDPAEVKKMNKKLEQMGSRFVGSSTGSGDKVAKLIQAEWQRILKGRDDVSFDLSYVSQGQNSIIMEIKGTSNPDEIIVVGGHLDSINGRGSNEVAPGADDDASGISSITGLISAIAKTGYKPSKTIQFMGYSAEEVGLIGSKQIAKAYKDKDKKVVGVLQLDMTGYNENVSPNIVVDYTNEAQNKLIKSLHDQFAKEIDFHNQSMGETRCRYGCSDHASWTAKGYPASIVFESTIRTINPGYHTKNDLTKNLSVKKMTSFSKLASAFVVKLSEDAVLLK